MKIKWKEFWAGATTFFTMSYIIFVNPAILSTSGTGMPFQGVLTATVLTAFIVTLLMGVFAKLPYALAPGMGLNAFFTYTIILGEQVPWQTALGMVFWSGIVFTILSITPVRAHIASAIPPRLRIGIAAGIGIMLSFIGFKNIGFIVADPVTFVKLGPLSWKVAAMVVAILVIFWLHSKRNALAFIAGILGVTVFAFFNGDVVLPDRLTAAPDFSTFMQLDLWGALKWSLLPAILSLMMTDFFDSISTFMGVSHATGMTDKEGEPLRLREGLLVDAIGTVLSGLFGTSSTTTYIESSAGIEAGGRTHWTAIFCALFFLPCLFIAPIVSMVPTYATAPVLIIIGAMMFRSLFTLRLRAWEEVFPVFLTMVLIPLTFSITQGILWGFITHTGLFVITGRRKEIPFTMYILTILAVLLLNYV